MQHSTPNGNKSKLVWLTDIHMTPAGETCYGHDPTIRLNKAIELINAHHSDAQFCMLTGDLVNNGDAPTYQYLQQLLCKLEIPYLAMVGNHDSRNFLHRYLNPLNHAPDGFIQYRVETKHSYLICLDTLEPGKATGSLCSERLAWLENTLRQSEKKPVYIFMHHHPQAIGLPMQDAECLENGETFFALLSKYSNIRHIFFGHVHRQINGSFQSIPFSSLNSTTLEAPPPVPEWNWDNFVPAAEAPMLGVISYDRDNTYVQYHQICDHRIGSPHS